jgi:hypothetical protein
MTRYTKDKLYELLPAIYRKRDSELRGLPEAGPLEELLSIIAEQVEILEDDIEKLYDNWFIETCDKWVIPYIEDLVGATKLNQLNKLSLIQRAYVANTIGYRRRKGTLAMLEQLAHDVTQWNAHIVEFFQLLSITQHVNHIRKSSIGVVNLRDVDALEFLGTPFDTVAAYNADVRQIGSKKFQNKTGHYYNIQNLGIFLWRLKAYHISNAPAVEHENDKRKLFFNQLGHDMQLFNRPEAEMTTNYSNSLSRETSVPNPIRIPAFYTYPELYYGDNNKLQNSISITVDGLAKNIRDIIVCDLTDWKHTPPKGKVAVDPLHGRMSFSDKDEEPHRVQVSYYYGFSSEVGGGSYSREPASRSVNENDDDSISKIVLTNPDNKTDVIKTALHEWQIGQMESNAKKTGGGSATFIIDDSQIYLESFDEISLPPGIKLEIHAGKNQRPVIKLLKPLIVNGASESSSQGSILSFDGLLLDRLNDNDQFETLLVINQVGDLRSLTIQHCTLVPKERDIIISDSTNPTASATKNSLQVKGISRFGFNVTLNRTIIGIIDMSSSDAKLKVTDSIVDGKGDSTNAIICQEALSIENTTIFGKVKMDLMNLANNTIFADTVSVKRRQQGCMRFCYIPEGSEVPSTYRCQPSKLATNSNNSTPVLQKIYPHFTSKRYGDPGYAQLYRDVPTEIFEGADNESEMGVFNHLYQAKRIKDLKYSLEEYMRLGLEAGIFMVT